MNESGHLTSGPEFGNKIISLNQLHYHQGYLPDTLYKDFPVYQLLQGEYKETNT